MPNIIIYPNQIQSEVSNKLLGHFVEHVPGNIPGGIYQPESSLANEDGVRQDVWEAMKKVGVTQIRWGGNFSSHYHWIDGVGPKSERPKKLNFAWTGTEDNHFGTVEFIQFCRSLGAEPVISVNMGSGTAEEAMDWVEYCNGTEDSYYANLRRSHGFEEPFGVKYWCLGNEMYGTWQFGHISAEDYAERAVHFAITMKRADPSIKLVACGLETDPDWNVTVARRLTVEKTSISPGEFIDYISLHYYPIGSGGAFTISTYEQRMALSQFFHERTRTMRSAIEVATDDPECSLKIVWDEWNLMGNPDGREFTLENTLWSASILNSFIRDSKYVEMANYTFFVNWVGPIQTSIDDMYTTAEYEVFLMYNELMGDQLLRLHADGLETLTVDMPIDTKWQQRQVVKKNTVVKRDIPYLDIAATRKSSSGEITLFVVNKNPAKAYDLQLAIDSSGMGDFKEGVLHTLWNKDISARNTKEETDNVRILRQPLTRGGNGWTITVKEHSVNALVLKP